MLATELPCALCGAPSQLARPDLPGYRVGTQYAIYSCAACGTSFADPMVVDEKVYEDIYRNPKDILGYARYAEFAESIQGAANPLLYLAEQEEAYWGVAEALRKRPQWKRILEIGSGLGYLTYALSKSGYFARGIDISAQAVAGARARFGDLYEVSDINAYRSRAGFEGWDAVVCTELIEHVPNVHEFVASALRLLNPGGGLLLTTPNKSAYPPNWVWETDLPPVHLWWFCERSIEKIANKHACDMSVVDFSEFYRTHQCLVPIKPPRLSTQSRLDAAGNSLALPLKRSGIRQLARKLLLLPGLSRLACRLIGRRKIAGSSGLVVCAALVPR